MPYNRNNKNIFTSWWWTVDRVTLSAVMLIIAIGSVMVTAASPAVAERIGLPSFYFVTRQLVYLALAVVTIMAVSFLSPRGIKHLASFGFLFFLCLLVIVLFTGMEAKGAKRWLFIGGVSIQPSEFMKPIFIVVTAWLLSEAKARGQIMGFKVSVALYALLVCLLILQPDFGMVVTVSAVWGAQIFLAGMPLLWIAFMVVIGIIGVFGAYIFLPHVAHRINSFIDSTTGAGESYQVKKSLEAFYNGGLLGRGPGEGTVKQYLPDSHTDFIFAVVGEELGAIACIIIIGIYAFIVIRGLRRMMVESDLFIVYAVSGLLMQFGVQTIINMGVAVNLLPTKGMTLPFMSYGGSSMIAISLGIGMVLALTKRRYGIMLRKPRVMV